MARLYKIPIPDVEKIKIAFDNYDSDSSGFIDRKEFKALLYELVEEKFGEQDFRVLI